MVLREPHLTMALAQQARAIGELKAWAAYLSACNEGGGKESAINKEVVRIEEIIDELEAM